MSRSKGRKRLAGNYAASSLVAMVISWHMAFREQQLPKVKVTSLSEIK